MNILLHVQLSKLSCLCLVCIYSITTVHGFVALIMPIYMFNVYNMFYLLIALY